jgi:LDH2 family malate/lactate/ureidoglycolate dehydrogenase
VGVTDGTDVVVAVNGVRAFAEGLFGALGMPAEDATLLVDMMVWAEVRGSPWLGFAKVPQYVERLRAGGTKPKGELEVVGDRGSSVVLDAHDVFGQVAGPRAMRIAVDRARSGGVGAVSVRNTTSAGTIGYLAMVAAEAGMIGLAINNSFPLQPPFGGTGRVLGNQAFAIAAPAGRHPPVLLDMATSRITLARIGEYRARGAELPPDLALDRSGRPTVDPAEALAGVLLPMAGHRGSGLALMWEILTGVLAGGERFGATVTSPEEHATPQAVSLFLLAIDPALSQPVGAFAARVDELVDRIHASPPVPEGGPVRVPGERGFAAAADRERGGIAMSRTLVATLNDLGRELGIRWGE